MLIKKYYGKVTFGLTCMSITLQGSTEAKVFSFQRCFLQHLHCIAFYYILYIALLHSCSHWFWQWQGCRCQIDIHYFSTSERADLREQQFANTSGEPQICEQKRLLIMKITCRLVRKVQKGLEDNNSTRPHQVPLPSAKNRKRWLQLSHTHNWTVNDK